MKKFIVAAIVVFSISLMVWFYFSSSKHDISYIKKQPSPDPSITIGEMLDGYQFFSKKEWTNLQDDRGRNLVVFNGDIDSSEISHAKEDAFALLKKAGSLSTTADNLYNAMKSTPNRPYDPRIDQAHSEAKSLYLNSAKANRGMENLQSCSVQAQFAINSDDSGYTMKGMSLIFRFMDGKTFEYKNTNKGTLAKAFATNTSIRDIIVGSLTTDEAPDYRY